MLISVRALLGHEALYVALQKGVGAHRLRYRCLEEIKPGDVVIDVGCGPAYYFDRLPADIRYFGFDTSERYIAHARKRWGHRGEFNCAVFTEDQLAVLPLADKIMMLGLLHHLTDDQSRDLLALAAKALAPGGMVITVDPCFEPTQGRISRWMSANDRGEHVRTPEAFHDLTGAAFGEVDGEILNETTRVPSSHWAMRLTKPLLTRA